MHSMHVRFSVPARCGLELEQTVDSPPLDLSQKTLRLPDPKKFPKFSCVYV